MKIKCLMLTIDIYTKPLCAKNEQIYIVELDLCDGTVFPFKTQLCPEWSNYLV